MNAPALRLLPSPRPLPAPRLVKLCAWCPRPQVRAREAAAHALGCAVTHGICRKHAAELRAEVAS